MKKDMALAPSVEAVKNIVDIRGRKCLLVKIDKAKIPDYIQEILCLSICDNLVPMGFVEKENFQGCFDISGGHDLKEACKYWKKQGLNLTEKLIDVFIDLIRGICNIENYLFVNDCFNLKWNNIYFYMEENKIRIAYIPNGEIHENLSNKIINLIDSSKRYVMDEEWNYNADQLQNIISHKDSLNEINGKLNEYGREITGRDWPDLSSLQQF